MVNLVFRRQCALNTFCVCCFRLECPIEERSPQKDRKFIVFESCLKKLFTSCQRCYAACRSFSMIRGTLLQVQTICANGHCLVWRSQPLVHGKPAGNLLISAAILFAGGSPTATIKMFRHIKICMISARTFFNYQRGYLVPAINTVWSQQEEELFAELQGRDIDVAGDGRCDSPGFSAKYLTYSIHVAQLNKIVHFEQVQVGEVSHTLNRVAFNFNEFFFPPKNDEVRTSTAMEKFGFVKCLEAMKEKSIKIASFTTDRHVQVAKYMRTHEPGIPHYYDGWHISKGITMKDQN